MNQFQMRARILTGSPKKNAACRSFSNMNGGISPGLVITYQNDEHRDQHQHLPEPQRFLAGSERVPHRHRGRRRRSGGQLLLRIALQHLIAQHVPDRLVQVDEARQ